MLILEAPQVTRKVLSDSKRLRPWESNFKDQDLCVIHMHSMHGATALTNNISSSPAFREKEMTGRVKADPNHFLDPAVHQCEEPPL